MYLLTCIGRAAGQYTASSGRSDTSGRQDRHRRRWTYAIYTGAVPLSGWN